MQKIKAHVSAKTIYFWNIAGSISNTLSSIVLLMLVTRFLGVKNGDIFTIAFAASQLLSTIAAFQVRVYQSTDVLEKFKFKHYFCFRLLTCAAMVLATFIYTYGKGYGLSTSVIVVLMCLYKLVDSISEVFQGFFQQKERLDLAGKAIFIKVLFPTLAFGIGVAVFRNLFAACLLLLAAEIVFFFYYDTGVYRWFKAEGIAGDARLLDGFSFQEMKQIFFLCLPLFINSYLIMDTYNVPKNTIFSAVEQGMLPDGAAAAYGIIFMPASVINLFLIVFRPLLTTMSYAWNQKQYRRLFTILGKICGSLVLFTAAAMAGAWLLGIPVLTLIYGAQPSLEPYKWELLILILGGGLNALANMVDNMVVIIRKQKYLLGAYVVSWGAIRILAPQMVAQNGLMGASLSYLISMVVLLLCNLVILLFCTVKLLRERKKLKG